MTPGLRRGLVAIVATFLVLAGFQVAQRTEISADIRAATELHADLEERLAAAATAGAELQSEFAALRAETATYDALLAARKTFTDAVAAVDKALASADGKVDTSAERASILALQETVLAERADPKTVTDAATSVGGVIEKVGTAVAEYDAEQARRAALALVWRGGASSTAPAAAATDGSGYARVRAALDRVGGGGVPLEEFGGACAGTNAPACASPGIIRYRADVATWSNARLNWVMAHELAHIYQYSVWGALNSSGGYGSLFGRNIEYLANCMAAARGYPSSNVSCSGEQLAWAGALWSRSVPY